MLHRDFFFFLCYVGLLLQRKKEGKQIIDIKVISLQS